MRGQRSWREAVWDDLRRGPVKSPMLLQVGSQRLDRGPADPPWCRVFFRIGARRAGDHSLVVNSSQVILDDIWPGGDMAGVGWTDNVGDTGVVSTVTGQAMVVRRALPEVRVIWNGTNGTDIFSRRDAV